MIVDCLVVSSLYDFSADLVVQELERRKAKYVRLNRENFESYRLTMDVQEESLEVRMNGANYRITTDLRAVYYRQPVFLRNTPGESLSIDEQLSRSQWMGFLRSLAIFDQARWMNPLNATYLAETKAYQLSVAGRIGFKVPKTLIGNDYARLREIDNRAIISAAPLTVQEYASPKIDLRVTVIGGEVTAVKITSAGRGIDEDWRVVDRDTIEYTEVDLPHGIERKCLKLLEVLGLNFGAIDLIESNGSYYFIEINPTGEWGWLVSDERRFDVDIANWLVGDK